ncbi:IS21 family transposase [Desulfofundulus thermobenzoicus]|uniref:IS21 family transposase n=1 Tax=Desulfofundulus thermobenzoicus TaxID=29376 RepID=A0A6N7IUF5_9FIRM|nr:IS21 family transposase [Desulfofundulus thermobenzoicus]MQL53755.1 IS21 family transposase [Desulfofundulus thermobenzoicus]
MPRRRLSMRKIKEILRLKWELNLGIRQIARSCNLSHSTVSEYLARAQAAGITWPIPVDLDDTALEKLLFPGNNSARRFSPEPDYNWIHQELKKKGVTLQLLWTEYKQQHPEGYQYSRFCELYHIWRKTIDPPLRLVHKAGEKMFVDYAGLVMYITNTATGEKNPAYIYVAVLGASNYTYAEATLTQDLYAWISAHCRAFEFFGGVTEIVVPDNTKTAVLKPCRYEPDLNPTYHEMATHYGTVIIPARAAHPRDKAKVETGVQVVERQVLAPLRHRTFFSLVELNQAIQIGVQELNQRPFQKLAGTRYQLFVTLDKPALKPLPGQRYEFALWKKVRVNIDYHVEVEANYYSAPYQLIHKEVDVRITANTVELLHKGQRVAVHRRRFGKGEYSTDPLHRPEKHQKYLEWTPERIVTWAKTTGPDTARMVEVILSSRPHPEQGYRSCLGVMRLGEKYSPELLEAACRRALASGAYAYRHVKSILEKGLDRVPLEEAKLAPREHPNLRGAAYYAQKGVR